MRDDEPPEEIKNVLVFRNSSGQPVAVPDDVVTQAERAYRCYMSHLGGKEWAVIAQEEGYPSARAAKYDVDRYMEEAKSLVTTKSQKEMLELETARLDYLQSQLWPAVQAGSIVAIKEVRAIIMDRAKVTTFISEIPDTDENGTKRTVVISGQVSSTSYIEGLKRAAGDDTPLGSTTDDE